MRTARFRPLRHTSPCPGDRQGTDPEPPAAHPTHGAPVPSVPLPASGGSVATALSSRHRAAARESGGARGALLPTGGLMPAWGAAFQQESLWGEERSRGGSPAAVTGGCHGGPAPPAGLSRVERPKCAALSRGGRAEHARVIVCVAVPPRSAPLRSEPSHPGCGAAPSAPAQRRPRPRSPAPPSLISP